MAFLLSICDFIISKEIRIVNTFCKVVAILLSVSLLKSCSYAGFVCSDGVQTVAVVKGGCPTPFILPQNPCGVSAMNMAPFLSEGRGFRGQPPPLLTMVQKALGFLFLFKRHLVDFGYPFHYDFLRVAAAPRKGEQKNGKQLQTSYTGREKEH
jgi:hypothetical protein